MKVLITEIRQESNSFNPLLSGLAHWKNGWLLEPNEVRDDAEGRRVRGRRDDRGPRGVPTPTGDRVRPCVLRPERRSRRARGHGSVFDAALAGGRGEPAAGRGFLLVSWRAANEGFRRRRGRDRPAGARVGSAPDAFSPRRSTCTGTSPRRSRPTSTSCAATIPTRTWTSLKRAAARRGWVFLR